MHSDDNPEQALQTRLAASTAFSIESKEPRIEDPTVLGGDRGRSGISQFEDSSSFSRSELPNRSLHHDQRNEVEKASDQTIQ